MAYLDPASTPGSKPQRFSVKNCKSSTSDKLQTFKTIFQCNSCNSWGYFQQEKSLNLSGKKKESMIWDKMGCINGCMVIANLVIYLVPYLWRRKRERKKDIMLTFSALSMILTMAVRSSNLPAAVKDIGDAAINTWYKVLSKILNTFSGVAALIFVARLLG
jgi:hypothetical protein